MARNAVLWACLFVIVLLIAVWLKHAIPDYLRQQSVASCNRYVQTHDSGSVPDNAWGRWQCEELGTTYPATSQVFTIGQTIVISNYRSFRVDSIERNWRPADEFEPQGDAIAGKEIIRVHLSVTNIGGEESDGFNPTDFLAIIRANGHEQRHAILAFDTEDQFVLSGEFPFQKPGDTLTMAVPFLVNPGEQPRGFAFLWTTLEPPLTPIARVVVDLRAQAGSGTMRFTTNEQFTVTQSVIY
jgi:hypothetical protein